MRACAALARPGGRLFFATINRNPKSYLFAVVGAEYVLGLLPQRHSRLREAHQAVGARAVVPRRRARGRSASGHDLQPAHQGLRARPRHRRELHGPRRAAGAAMTIRAVLFDLDGTFADTAPDLAGALNRLRGRARAARRCRWSTRAASPRTGARGMLRVGFGMIRSTPSTPRCGREFLDLYAENICRDTRLFAGIGELLAASRAAACRGASSPTRRSGSPCRCSPRSASPRAPPASWAATRPAGRSRIPIRCCIAAACLLGLAPAACLYVGDDLRDVAGRTCRRHAGARGGLRLPRRRGRPVSGARMRWSITAGPARDLELADLSGRRHQP